MKQMTRAEIESEMLDKDRHSFNVRRGYWDGLTYYSKVWNERSRCWLSVPQVFYWRDEPVEVIA